MIMLNRELFVYNENTSETEDNEVFDGYIALTARDRAHLGGNGNWIGFETLELLLLFIKLRIENLDGVDDIKGMWDVQVKTVREAAWNDDEKRTLCEISWCWGAKDTTPDGKAKWVIANVELVGTTLEQFFEEGKALGYQKEEA